MTAVITASIVEDRAVLLEYMLVDGVIMMYSVLLKKKNLVTICYGGLLKSV